MSDSTSSRTAGPNRRRTSSRSSACEQVVDVVLFDGQVLVAGDAEQRGLDDVHAGEQLRHVRGDDVLEQDEPPLADRDKPRQHRGDLDPGEVLAAVVAVADDDGEVQRQPGDVGKRVRGVDRERGQDREDVLREQACPRVFRSSAVSSS